MIRITLQTMIRIEEWNEDILTGRGTTINVRIITPGMEITIGGMNPATHNKITNEPQMPEKHCQMTAYPNRTRGELRI